MLELQTTIDQIRFYTSGGFDNQLFMQLSGSGFIQLDKQQNLEILVLGITL